MRTSGVGLRRFDLSFGRVAALVLTMSMAIVFPQVSARADTNEVVVVSLGDSYTSGTGAENYYGDDQCYRSYDSYPWRYVKELTDSGQPASIWHYACNRARINDVYSQMDQVPDSVRQDARLVLLSIGGNDFEFQTVVIQCVITDVTLPLCDSTLNGVMDRMQATMDRQKSLLRDIGSRFPNATHVVLVGYPFLLSPKCGGLHDDLISSLQASMNLQESTNITELNTESGSSRFVFVSLQDLYAGRGPCSSSSIADGTPDSEIRYIRRPLIEGGIESSFHPTKHGHQATADLLFSLFSPSTLTQDGGLSASDTPTDAGEGPTGLRISLTESPFHCDGGVRKLGTLEGALAGERIEFSSPSLTGLLPGIADHAGGLELQWQCDPKEAGTSWEVTATGVTSGLSGTFVVVGGASP